MNSSLQHLDTNRRMSQAVIHGETVYLAGQVSQLSDGDVREQAQDIFGKIDALLARSGSHKGALLSAQIWLRDIEDFAGMNLAWEEWLQEVKAPVRACVLARLAKPHYRLEVQVIAAL